MMVYPKMNIQKLINLVRRHEEIYDYRNPKHRDKEHIARVWRHIASEMKNTVDHTKRRWWNLRSNFMREKRKLRKMFSEGVVQPKTYWPHFESLLFIDLRVPAESDSIDNFSNDHFYNPLNVKESPSNYNFPSEDGSCFDDPATDDVIENKYQIPQEDVAEYLSTKGRVPSSTAGDEVVDQMEHKFDDADFMFLQSLLPAMKKLGTIESLEFKAEVIHLLKTKLQQKGIYD